MTDHWAKTANLVTGQPDPSVLRAAFFDRIAYIVKPGENPQDLVPQDPSTGAIVRIVWYNNKAFHYDPLDLVSAHDGVSVLVIAGKRYKTEVVPLAPLYALARQDTPPATPAIGDAYLVGVAPTGAWSAKAKHLALYSVRGWEFIAPRIGMIVYLSGSDVYYRYSAAGDWLLGFGISQLGSASVLPSHLTHITNWRVENQTTNAPPAVVNNVAYIIGPAPTGAWSGHAGKIAHGEAGAWVIYAPAEGWAAYDKAQRAAYRFQSGVWVSDKGAWARHHHVFTGTAITPSLVGGNPPYLFTSGSAPATAEYRVPDPVPITFQARAAGVKLRIRYSCSVTSWGNSSGVASGYTTNYPAVLALFRDGESSAIDWSICNQFNANFSQFENPGYVSGEFIVSAIDAASHDYSVSVMAALKENGASDFLVYVGGIARRLFQIEEAA